MNQHASSSKMRSGVIKRGSTWSYVLRVADGTGVSKQKWVGGFSTEREAKLARAKALTDLDKGKFAAPSKVTVAVYFSQWLDGREMDLKPKTIDGYRYLVNGYILPALGKLKLQSLSPRKLSDFYRDLSLHGGKGGGPLSKTTVNRIAALVKKVLKDAVYVDQLLSSNPAEQAITPRQSNVSKTSDLWDAAQLKAFLTVAEQHRLHAVLWLAAYTGLRRGELLALRWSDVDFANQLVRVHRSVSLTSKGAVEGTTKNHKERFVSIDASTVEVLQAHRLRQTSEREFAMDSWEGTDYVFCTEFGFPVYPTTLTHLLHKLIVIHNQENPGMQLSRIRFHDLRHIHATLLLEAGVPVHVVAARLGHADPAITLRTYAHVLRSQETSAANTFAESINTS